MSVMVMPYRHPLHWARIATTIDQLSTGRLILGVGVGWMEEEFAAMNAPFKERGKISDEQLTLLKRLWTDEHITFHGNVLQRRRHRLQSQAAFKNRAFPSGSAAKANTRRSEPVFSATPGFPTSCESRPRI